jgi:HSP20 family protein
MANMLPALKSSFDRLREEIDSTFDRWMPKLRGTDVATKETSEPWGLPSLFMTTRPTIDMDEDENEIRITAEMPGLEKTDFKVELVGSQLVIRGDKKESREEKKKNAYYSERSYGSFARSISLPSEVDPEKVEASYKNGVLNIRLPKTEQSKAKRIDVQVS